VESLVNDQSFLAKKGSKVLVTGHTGFKGAWLVELLLMNSIEVSGLSLPPQSNASLYDVLDHSKHLEEDSFVDIRNFGEVCKTVESVKPDIVFHLAAQAFVRRSYREPLLTWQVNLNGTLNLVQALHRLNKPITLIVITTDKVYRNKEWEFSYRENDELGGIDPYSASKAACELAVDSWRSSFSGDSLLRIATVRAGNVIGGGDNGEDRLVPDCYNAWEQGKEVLLRNPKSVRPWQHVLEPLSGYIVLANHIANGNVPEITSCNFGPGENGSCTVQTLVEMLANGQSDRNCRIVDGEHPHEAKNLTLSIDRALQFLAWSPKLSLREAVAWTDKAYSASRLDLADLIRSQINSYLS
jgi:CDP-glucose 4,6-dehydratase